MKTIQIGSFEAKTHFSELLKAVEAGKIYDILRRGKPVARLMRHTEGSAAARLECLISKVRRTRGRNPISLDEILEWKNAGRK